MRASMVGPTLRRVFTATCAAVFTCVALIPSTTILPSAQAADPTVSVGYEVLGANDAVMAGNDCEGQLTNVLNIPYGDFATTVGQLNMPCYYLRAFYRYTLEGEQEPRNLPITAIRSTGTGRVEIVPDMTGASAEEVESQSYVRLSIPADQVATHIVVQLADNREALNVQFVPNDPAKEMLTFNGQLLTDTRNLRAPKSADNTYTVDFTVSLPRDHLLTFPTVTVGGVNKAASVDVVSDDSTWDTDTGTGQTIRRYRATFTNVDTKVFGRIDVNLGNDKKRVPVSATMGQSHVFPGVGDESKYASAELDNCGDGQCRVWSNEVYASDWVRNANGDAVYAGRADSEKYGSHPFFFATTNTTAGNVGTIIPEGESAGIPTNFGRRVGLKGISPDWLVYFSGWDRTDFQIDSSHPVDNAGGSFFTPQTQELFKAQSYMPQSVNVASQAYGGVKDLTENQYTADNKVEFYVQYSGVSPAMLGHKNDSWNTFYGRTLDQQYSWFLDRVRVNDEWYPVPFPQLDASDIVDNAQFDATQQAKYRSARDKMLGAKKTLTQGLPFPMGDSSASAAGGLDMFQWHPWDTDSCREVYAPKTYAEYTVTRGVNAGTTIRVEMVNARTAGDYRADGYSLAWNAGDYFGRWVNRLFTPQRRNDFSWFNGPAMQMLDNTTCIGVPTQPFRRGIAAQNQWKTMYRITIEGMAADSYDIGVAWGITSQGFFANAGGSVLENTAGKSQAIDLKTKDNGWQTFAALPQTGVGGETITRSNVAEVNSSQPASESNANVRFTLRDGYVKPVVRATTDAGTPVVDTGSGSAAAVDSVYSGSDLAAIGSRTFLAAVPLPNDSGKQVTAGTLTTSFGLSNPGYLSVSADPVKIPIMYLQNTVSATLGDADPRGVRTGALTGAVPNLADATVVPAQWNGPTAQGASYIGPGRTWQLVDGKTPPVPSTEAEAGKAFVGYRVYGVKYNASQTHGFDAVDSTQAVANTVNKVTPDLVFSSDKLIGLYPGDALDVATAQILLSNDAGTAQRFDAVWLSPVFGSPVDGERSYYTATFKTVDGERIDDAFTFVGAPGVQVDVTPSYVAPATLTFFGRTYSHNAVNDVVSVAALSSVTSVSGLEFIYDKAGSSVIIRKKWTVNDVTYENGAQPPQLAATASTTAGDETTGLTFDARSRIAATPIPYDVEDADTLNQLKPGAAFSLSETFTSRPGYSCTLESAKLVKKDGTLSDTDGSSATASENKLTIANQYLTAPKPYGSIAGVVGTTTNPATKVDVTYYFASADPTRPALPAAVTGLLPPATQADYGSLYTPPALAQSAVTDGDGTWVFEGWDQTAVSPTDVVHFTGRWQYVDGEKDATYYLWEVPAGITGVVGSALPDLPEAEIRDKGAAASAPPTPDPAEIETPFGTLKFQGWSGTGTSSVQTGKWVLPSETRTISYAYSVLDGYTVTQGSTIDILLNGALPDANDVARRGELVLPSDVVPTVQFRSMNDANQPDSGLVKDGVPQDLWGTLVFAGWDKDEDHSDGDVTFTAQFRVVPGQWLRTPKTTNLSNTVIGASRTDRVVVPEAIVRAIRARFAVLDTSRKKVDKDWVFDKASWEGVRFEDEANHGTWSFGTTGRRDNTIQDGIYRGTDGDNRDVSSSGADTRESVSMYWNFTPDPVYTLHNTVKCTTTVRIGKILGKLDPSVAVSGVPTPADESRDAGANYQMTITTNDQTLTGNGSVLAESTSVANATKATVSETPTATASGMYSATDKTWTCVDAAVVSQAGRSAEISFGLGAKAKCVATNLPTQVTLLARKAGSENALTSAQAQGVTLAATPRAGTPTLAAITVNDPASGVATTDNTRYAGPGRAHELTVANQGMLIFLGYKRYTGSEPNGEVFKETDKWETVPLEPAASAGAAVNEVAVATPGAATHEVYAAEFGEIPTPLLPLTGGTAKDLYLILGVGGLLLAGLTVAAHKRRSTALA